MSALDVLDEAKALQVSLGKLAAKRAAAQLALDEKQRELDDRFTSAKDELLLGASDTARRVLEAAEATP